MVPLCLKNQSSLVFHRFDSLTSCTSKLISLVKFRRVADNLGLSFLPTHCVVKPAEPDFKGCRRRKVRGVMVNVPESGPALYAGVNRAQFRYDCHDASLLIKSRRVMQARAYAMEKSPRRAA